MSMQINVDPSGLTQAQREAVAGFILAYPTNSKKNVGLGSFEVNIDASKAQATLDNLQKQAEKLPPALASTLTASIAPEDAPNVGALTPVEVFGAPLMNTFATDTPVAAFGVPPAPNVQSVNVPANTLAPAPNTNLAPPPPASNGVELDANGLPWNAKIHAESKAKIADGTWRKKRGVDPALVATVEAELRQLMSAPGASSVPPPPAPIVAQVTAMAAAPILPGAVIIGHPGGPLTVVATTGEQPAAVAAPADARQQFVSLIGRTSAAVQAGKITQAEVTQICTLSGVPALPLLANRLDLVAQIAASIDALIASR